MHASRSETFQYSHLFLKSGAKKQTKPKRNISQTDKKRKNLPSGRFSLPKFPNIWLIITVTHFKLSDYAIQRNHLQDQNSTGS